MKTFKGLWVLVGLVFIVSGCGSKNASNSPSSPAPLCSNPSQSGVTTATSSSLALSGGNLYAEPVTLSSNATVISLSVYLTGFNASVTNSGQGWMALYNDNGSGAPGNLLITSNPQDVVNGWNSFTVTNVDTYFLATKYWIAFQFSNSSNFGPDNSPGGLVSAAYTWGVFPDVFPSSSATSLNIEAYVSTCP